MNSQVSVRLKSRISKTHFLPAAIAVLMGIASANTTHAATPTFSSIYDFYGEDGSNPNGKLLFDAAGNLYGTTYNGGVNGKGTIFKLTAGANGWSETVLYSFKGLADGANPAAGLVMDANGSLYGTASTSNGLPDGVVFQLKLTDGTYAYSVLHTFGTALDGSFPNSDLVFGPKGTIYGTTVSGGSGFGTVFALVPPTKLGGTWTESVIYRFTGADDGANPYSGLTFDSNGNLYGTATAGGTAGAGSVFELTPPVAPATIWSETTLYDFMGTTDGTHPLAGIVIGPKGAIFGTAYLGGDGFGTVFELVPPAVAGNPYTETTILTFKSTNGADPSDALLMDSAGNLYGTTGGAVAGIGGNVFKLVPPAAQGGAFTAYTLYTFSGGADGQAPLSSVIRDKSGALFGTTFYGGAGGSGSVFSIK
jgi:uncharacterized repeat protein (TIGR03803 family)